MKNLNITKDASISDCTKYRYWLSRKWGSGAVCTFIMLNPSTADANIDDPTIRRCINFAIREGCEAVSVVNLFAYRATKPIELSNVQDPIGPVNEAAIRNAIHMAEKHEWPIIAAWGAHWMAIDQGAEIADLGRFSCLGKTKDGHPKHPLYLKNDTPLIPYN